MTEREIYRAARDLADPAARDAFLDKACAGDPALRERVELLLRSYDVTSDFHDGPATPPGDKSSPAAIIPVTPETATFPGGPPEPGSFALAEPEGASAPDSVSPTPRTDSAPRGEGIGTVIAGRYTLIEVIGEGGMGSVYLANQTEPVKRQVALKLIKSGMDSKAVLARFDAERQALALMDHPNIARVYDGGTTPAGQPFFVMELVKGVPLTEYCDRQRLSVRDRLELFVAVCQAVQHAHQKGIIHRDLKPGNVLVVEVDGRPTPKVIDFGVAKATDYKLTDMSFADVGAIVGTPAYMSPEQADPSSMDIDTRTDVYALGVMLYELLTGSPPIEAGLFKRGAILEMLRIVREVEPPRPSTKLSTSDALPNIAANRDIEPAMLEKLLQGELDWVVMKAMEKDRTRRYETANGLARDIQRFLADEVVEARPPNASYRLRKFVRKHRAALTTGAVIVLLLLAGSVVSTWQAVRATRAETAALTDRSRAVAAERIAQQKAKEAEDAQKAEATQRQVAERRRAATEAVIRYLTTDMIASANPEKAQGRDLTVKEVLDRAAERVGNAFRDQPEIEAAVRLAIGKTYLGLGKFPPAEEQLKKSVALATKALGPVHEDTLETTAVLAAVYQKLGKLALAETTYRKNLAAWLEHFGEGHRGTMVGKQDLALVLHFLGKDEEAETLLRQVVEQTRPAPENPVALNARQNLAQLLLERGQLNEAVPLVRANVKIVESQLGDKHPNTLNALNTLGRVLQTVNKFDEAIAVYRKVLAQRKLVQGDHHVDSLVAMGNLASALHAANKLDEAEPLYREALTGTRKLQGDDHSDTVALVNNLATFYFAQGKFAEAEPLFQQARITLTKLVGPEHPMTLMIASNLATVLGRQNKRADAEKLYRETLAVQRRTVGPQHPTTTQTLHNLAELLREKRQWDEAVALFAEAVGNRRASLPPDHPHFIASLVALGGTLTDKGDPKKAEPVLREALAAAQRAFLNGDPFIAPIQTLLGACLTAQKRFGEAETLLLAGYERMKQSEKNLPAQGREPLINALDRLIELYTATNKPEEVQKWQTQRRKYPPLKAYSPPEKK